MSIIEEFDPFADPEQMVECCLSCGSAGTIHFEAGESPENTSHRCQKCLFEYVGCNFGRFNIEPYTRLSGLQPR